MIGQKQIIIFDSQIRNRRQLLDAIKKEAERYVDRAIGTLPLRGNSKADIDNYIFTYGVNDYVRVVDGALGYDLWCQLNKIRKV